MLLLARCLDWLCQLFASGAQDEVRLNALIARCGARDPLSRP